MLSEDFEYTIDKYLVPKIRLRCPLHSKEPAQYVCTETSCRRQSILCRSCQVDNADHCQAHKTSFKSVDTYLVDVTADMETITPANKTILNEIYASNPSMEKWQADDEMHLQKLEAHISTQKAVIDDDMAQLSTLLISSLDDIRERLHAKLDLFYKKYCDAFNQQKNSLSENFGLSKHFLLYINPSTLAAKLQSEMPAQAAAFVTRLNRSIENAKLISANKASFISNFKAINAQLSRMTDNLPCYLPSDQIQQQVNSVSKLIESFFDSNVTVPGEESQQPSSGSAVAAGGANSPGVPQAAPSIGFGSLAQQQSLPQFQQQQSYSPISGIPNTNNNNNTSIAGFGASASNAMKVQSQQSLQYVAPSPAIGIPANNSNANINNSNNKKQFKISKTGKSMQLKNTESNISIKPVKKFQLEIPICSIAALSETHFALASVNDGKLKIFESSAKKMQIFVAHASAITFVTKIKTVFDSNYPNQVNSNPRLEDLSSKGTDESKRIMIATASTDQTVLLTKYDIEKNTLPQQYMKLSGFVTTPQFILDVQDGIHILTGDSFGEVQIWNFHEGRIVHTLKGRHSGKIVGIYLMKPQKRFIVVSDDAISIWKYQLAAANASNGGSNASRIDRVFQESVIQSDGTSIGRIVSFLPTYRDNVCFIGNNDGEILVYDLMQRKTLHKWNAHGRVPVIELCLFELEDKKDIGMLISIGLSDKSIKTWKVNSTDDRGTSFYVGEPTLLDGNSLNDDIYSKNKIQIVQASCPKLVIANEREKEFLLYNLFL